MNCLAILGIDQLGAPDRAVRADAGADVVCLDEARMQLPRLRARRSGAARAFSAQLPGEGPVGDGARKPGCETRRGCRFVGLIRDRDLLRNGGDQMGGLTESDRHALAAALEPTQIRRLEQRAMRNDEQLVATGVRVQDEAVLLRDEDPARYRTGQGRCHSRPPVDISSERASKQECSASSQTSVAYASPPSGKTVRFQQLFTT